MRVLNALPLALLLGLLCASPALAQQGSNLDDGRLLTVGAMDAALAEHEPAVDQQRARLAELLAEPRVRELAGERGIDMGRVTSMADGLSDTQIEGLAPLVAESRAALQDGGLGTVTIGVGALIIILLIVILVA